MKGKTSLYILVIILLILLYIVFLKKEEKKEENFNNSENNSNIEAFTENWNFCHKSLTKDWKPKKTSKLQLWCPTNPKDAKCVTY